MRDRHGDEVLLRLPQGDIVFRFDIAAGENAILPFGIRLGDATLNWATAQPLARLGDTWFFLAPDGMRPVYCIDGKVTEAAPGEAFTAGALTVMTLSRRDSLGFWVYGDTAWLCDRPLLWDGKQLKAEMESGSADVLRWSDAEKRFVPCAHFDTGRQPTPVAFRAVGTGRYAAELRPDMLRGHKQVLLRVLYEGDIGSAFVGGQMISDNFCNGDFWDIRLDDCADALEKEPLVLYLTPKKENVTVDTSSMAGLREQADITEGRLLSAELVAVDDYPVNTIRVL